MDEAVRILDEFAYEIISQREIEGRDGKSGADTDVSRAHLCRTATPTHPPSELPLIL